MRKRQSPYKHTHQETNTVEDCQSTELNGQCFENMEYYGIPVYT